MLTKFLPSNKKGRTLINLALRLIQNQGTTVSVISPPFAVFIHDPDSPCTPTDCGPRHAPRRCSSQRHPHPSPTCGGSQAVCSEGRGGRPEAVPGALLWRKEDLVRENLIEKCKSLYSPVNKTSGSGRKTQGNSLAWLVLPSHNSSTL